MPMLKLLCHMWEETLPFFRWFFVAIFVVILIKMGIPQFVYRHFLLTCV